MKQRGLILLWILMSMTLAVYGCAETGEDATGTAAVTSEAEGHQIATFAVQDLDQDATIALTTALANNKGVLSAEAIPEDGLYKVAFRSGDTTPEAVLAAMIEVHPQVSLREVTEAKAEAGKHACGGCPMQNSCAESH